MNAGQREAREEDLLIGQQFVLLEPEERQPLGDMDRQQRTGHQPVLYVH